MVKRVATALCAALTLASPASADYVKHYYGISVPRIDYDRRPNTVFEIIQDATGEAAYRHITYCNGDEDYGGQIVSGFSQSYTIDTCADL